VDVLPNNASRLLCGMAKVTDHLFPVDLPVRKENGVGSASPGWGVKRSQFTVRPSSRGAYPS